MGRGFLEEAHLGFEMNSTMEAVVYTLYEDVKRWLGEEVADGMSVVLQGSRFSLQADPPPTRATRAVFL